MADQQLTTDHNVTIEEKSSQIKELLAEATGIVYEEPKATLPSRHNLPMTLEERLRVVFNLPSSEVLRGEWICYIVQSALVPGCMYLTDNFICFYASLPKGQLQFHKSGYLLIKRAGKMKSNYERYYFDIQNDVLAWYENPTDNYSPLGKIDLKSILAIRQSVKRKYGFRIKTTTKNWHFQADTKAAMIEWTNALQKAIFKANNSGSNLKIVLPFQNVLDIEQTEAFEFQKFLKIRAVGIDDSFVMDEYYFSYFANIENTFQHLKSAWESHSSFQQTSSTPISQSPTLSISDLHEPKPPSVPSSTIKRMNTVVSSALSVPGAIKDYLYPSISSNSKKSTEKLEESSSSGDEDYQAIGWLHGKRQSGMKLVYGLLGGAAGSPSIALENEDEEEDEEDDDPVNRADEAEVLDDRTITNFRKYFVLPETEKLLTVYRCSYMKTLPCYGKLYISTNYISFNSKGFASKAKIIIPFTDVIRIQKLRSRGYIFHSLSITTQTKREIFLEFSSISRRNSCFASLFIQHKRVLESEPDKAEETIRDWEAKLMEDELRDNQLDHVVPQNATLPILSRSMSSESIMYKKPERSLHFTCITIGTRGDVQPYIALCKGLMKDGHRCRIATHDEFKDWIEEHGIEFRTVGGDPGELMRICVENNFFSVNFVREGLRLFKDWIDELLSLAWEAVQGTDVIIESPSAMVGIHMAEALGVPYFRSFPMPMTRTRSFPHPFATPNHPKGRLYNDMTYVLFDYAVWRAIATRTNAFRKNKLKIPATSYEKLEVWKIPYLYSFSPNIVPSPLDWLDWIHCTGYWFLDNPQTGWKPEEKLKAFVESKDTRPLVYIGFGSIIVSDPKEITRIIVESVLLSNVRAIVSRGWSSRLQGVAHEEDDILKKHPDTIFSIQSVPHDWLFPQVRAVVHHGGAGTTAAGLRAGRPTIIKPFFADQFFWGERVEEMGIGRCIKKLTVESLSAALRVVSTDEHMLKLAKKVGEKISSEAGVDTAIQCIYRDMELAKARTLSSIQKNACTNDQEYIEEDWTLIDEATASGSISPETWMLKEQREST
ncbi:hypothetical protein RMATCC62417_03641 [Rhizopus microsporus]|nr:hypothetical protein RMATCC62417_03641 [Rhizopus microsporus]